MKARCRNLRNPSYALYGGRGITVCERWIGPKGFQNFLSDMNRRPSQLYSLDRIDNNGNYEPSNCHWAIAERQANNRRDNRLLRLGHQSLTLSQWARSFGLARETLAHRLKKGWSLERALTEPKR